MDDVVEETLDLEVKNPPAFLLRGALPDVAPCEELPLRDRVPASASVDLNADAWGAALAGALALELEELPQSLNPHPAVAGVRAAWATGVEVSNSASSPVDMVVVEGSGGSFIAADEDASPSAEAGVLKIVLFSAMNCFSTRTQVSDPSRASLASTRSDLTEMSSLVTR